MSAPAPDPAAPSSRLERVTWFLLVLLPFLLVAAYQWSFRPPLENDDYAQYLMHAEALSEGRPYGDIGYLYTPFAPRIGPALEPPGWPLTLAPVLAAAGRSATLLKLLVLGFALAFALLAGRYFARKEDPWLGAGAALMAGLAVQQAYATTSFGADLGFGLLLWVVVVLADEPGGWSWPRVAAITLAGLFAVMYRTVGIVLIPAILLFAFVHRREHGWRPLVPMGIWALAVWLVYFQAGVGLGMDTAVSTPLIGNPNRPELTALDRAWRTVTKAATRVLNYRRGVFQGHLYPITTDPWEDLYHVASVGFMAAGLVLYFRKRFRSFLAVFTLCYVGALVLSKVQSGRYLWPLYPLLAFGMLNGIRAAGARWFPAGWRPLASLAALGVALAVSAATVVTIYRTPEPESLETHHDAGALFDHLRTLNGRSPIRVAFVKPRVLAWGTGIPAMGTFSASETQMLGELGRLGITHVVLGDLGMKSTADEAFARLVAEHPEEFAMVYANASFRVFGYRP